MKSYKLLLVIVIAGGLLGGCDDEFLTTVPHDRITEATFWKTDNDFILAVNALYSTLYGWQSLYLDAASDNAWAQKSFSDWYPLGNGSADATAVIPNQFWTNSYRGIYRANEILARLEKASSLSESIRRQVEGEARFFRAYHYMYLVNLFGDVPLVTKVITPEEARKIPRTHRNEVANLILDDLEIAASLLPEFYPQSDYGRITKWAALALKARAALYEARWAEAADAAKRVIDSGRFCLYPDYINLFRYAGEGSCEAILVDRRMKNERPHSAFTTFGPRSLGGGSDVVPLRSLVDSYYMIDGLPISASPLYDPDNPYANRDLRLYGTLLYPGAEFAGIVYNSLPDSPTPDRVGNDWNATATGYQMIKYVDPADKDDVSNSGIDIQLIRYAEVLLTYAEAKIELNEVDNTVYDAINQVRARAGLSPVPSGLSQDSLRAIVRHERRVELALEGLRLFDIRRWRIAEDVMNGPTYGIDYKDENGETKTIFAEMRRFTIPRDYLWPIPLKEIELSEVLEQNPGW